MGDRIARGRVAKRIDQFRNRMRFDSQPVHARASGAASELCEQRVFLRLRKSHDRHFAGRSVFVYGLSTSSYTRVIQPLIFIAIAFRCT